MAQAHLILPRAGGARRSWAHLSTPERISKAEQGKLWNVVSGSLWAPGQGVFVLLAPLWLRVGVCVGACLCLSAGLCLGVSVCRLCGFTRGWSSGFVFAACVVGVLCAHTFSGRGRVSLALSAFLWLSALNVWVLCCFGACPRACLCTCVYVHACGCACGCACAHTCMCMWVCAHICMCARMHAYVCTRASVRACTCADVCTCVGMHVHACAHTHMYVYVHVCAWVCTCVRTCMHVRMCMCGHMCACVCAPILVSFYMRHMLLCPNP